MYERTLFNKNNNGVKSYTVHTYRLSWQTPELKRHISFIFLNRYSGDSYTSIVIKIYKQFVNPYWQFHWEYSTTRENHRVIIFVFFFFFFFPAAITVLGTTTTFCAFAFFCFVLIRSFVPHIVFLFSYLFLSIKSMNVIKLVQLNGSDIYLHFAVEKWLFLTSYFLSYNNYTSQMMNARTRDALMQYNIV